MAFRFVHSADIHLDSPLKSLALRNTAVAQLVSNATREAFVRIVDLCIEEGVDALLLAGDLYDGDQTSMKTARFFAEQMRRLDAAGIKTFILRGNHDALSKITKELVLPESVTVFGGRAEAVAVEREGALPDIVIHGLSFANPKAPESLFPKYKSPVPVAVNIGMMHTSLNGAPGHDPYAPCSMTDLDESGFHYWALGHIHKRFSNAGKCTVVMPGNPQGRDINEAGPKSVSLVTVRDDCGVEVEERNVSVAQFERLVVDLNGVDDWRDLVALIAKDLGALRRNVSTEQLIVRLHLTGASSLQWVIRRDIDILQQEIELQAELIGASWIEKIELKFEAVVPDPGETADTISQLRRLIVDDVSQSDGFRAQMAEYASELVKALPADLRDMLGGNEEEHSKLLDQVVLDGADDVLARLRSPLIDGGL